MKREIDTDLGIPELRMALEQIGGSEQMSQQQIQALDQTLATFMQAVDQAVGVIQQRAEQLDRAANKSVIAGTTRKARGALLAELKALEQEALAVQQEMLAADDERAHQQAHLAELKAQTPSW